MCMIWIVCLKTCKCYDTIYVDMNDIIDMQNYELT